MNQNANHKSDVRVVACGALAREILAVCETNKLDHINLTCLPAILHNHPEKIPDAVDKAIVEAKAEGFENIFIAYADCGTGGLLDAVCQKHNVERIAGPHCYSFFWGNEAFEARDEDDIYTFFLTDFLARQFKAFMIDPLKLDKHPELIEMMFGRYKKLVYLEQLYDEELEQKARNAADFLGLSYEKRVTGYGDLTPALTQLG
jgi:hypothetical protein